MHQHFKSKISLTIFLKIYMYKYIWTEAKSEGILSQVILYFK